jgi:hypothetical protein
VEASPPEEALGPASLASVKGVRRYALLAVVLVLGIAGCVDEQHAVVTTAQGSIQPWACAESETTMTKVSDATYKLRGCGAEATYVCNFAFQPPRCWRP